MSAIGPVKVDVKAEKSCNNWSCCFSWVCCTKKRVVAPVQPDSPISLESIEKVTTTYERHRIHHTPDRKPALLKRSAEMRELAEARKAANVDLGAEETKESTKD